MKMNKQGQKLYESPMVESVEMQAQAIICQSNNGINDMRIDPDAGDQF